MLKIINYKIPRYYTSSFFTIHKNTILVSFRALILLVGRQGVHSACKNRVMRCSCDYLSEARCRLFATAKLKLVLPFCYHLTQVVLEKRPLNVCHSSSFFTILLYTDCYSLFRGCASYYPREDVMTADKINQFSNPLIVEKSVYVTDIQSLHVSYYMTLWHKQMYLKKKNSGQCRPVRSGMSSA